MNVVIGPRDLHGRRVWVVTFGGIGLWLVHLFAETSLAGYSHTHHWVVAVMTTLTVVLALLTAGLTLIAWRITAGSAGHEGEQSAAGRAAFIGWFGVYTGAINLLLIVGEGIYIAVVSNHG